MKLPALLALLLLPLALAVALVPLAVVRLLEWRDRRRREAGALRRDV